MAVHVELQDIPAPASYWRTVIAQLRSVFSGELTASCNAGGGGEDLVKVSYWDALDYIGIDAFPYIGSDKVISVDATAKLWASRLASYKQVAAKFGKRLLFTQIGYPSCEHCGEKNAHEKYKTPSQQCQINAYTGMFQSLWNDDTVAGLYWWNWLNCEVGDPNCQVGPDDNGESPQNKGAQDTIAHYYGGGTLGV